MNVYIHIHTYIGFYIYIHINIKKPRERKSKRDYTLKTSVQQCARCIGGRWSPYFHSGATLSLLFHCTDTRQAEDPLVVTEGITKLSAPARRTACSPLIAPRSERTEWEAATRTDDHHSDITTVLESCLLLS